MGGDGTFHIRASLEAWFALWVLMAACGFKSPLKKSIFMSCNSCILKCESRSWMIGTELPDTGISTALGITPWVLPLLPFASFPTHVPCPKLPHTNWHQASYTSGYFFVFFYESEMNQYPDKELKRLVFSKHCFMGKYKHDNLSVCKLKLE